MPNDIFTKWLTRVAAPNGVVLYEERPASRQAGLRILKRLLAQHFIGEATILQAGGYPKAAEIIANSLPSSKKTRSGDLGELLATEYVNTETAFNVPINKLCWKSDREMPMHGNDVIGVDAASNPVRVLKAECKSRSNFSAGVVNEAGESLDLHGGRPNPSTLAFITKRLYEQNRDQEADIFRDLQSRRGIAARNITQMIFALAGNNPADHLANGLQSRHRGVKRENAAIVIDDHKDFVTTVFEMYGA